MARDAARPRIARIWRGRTARERADEYAAYLYEAGIRSLEERALGVQQLREDREHDTEFVTISYWASVEAMASFAGQDDPTRIHHLERDPEFLLELPETVQILEITVSTGDTGGTVGTGGTGGAGGTGAAGGPADVGRGVVDE